VRFARHGLQNHTIDARANGTAFAAAQYHFEFTNRLDPQGSALKRGRTTHTCSTTSRRCSGRSRRARENLVMVHASSDAGGAGRISTRPCATTFGLGSWGAAGRGFCGCVHHRRDETHGSRSLAKVSEFRRSRTKVRNTGKGRRWTSAPGLHIRKKAHRRTAGLLRNDQTVERRPATA
jgi:hypothetical protein